MYFRILYYKYIQIIFHHKIRQVLGVENCFSINKLITHLVLMYAIDRDHNVYLYVKVTNK
jgi:hypothetical protein